ncbi:hypothetical protein F2Q69_00049594 [Brassica cretica]|uniref:Uncharacterized protein n=1 Tax=Brassica cretica TaxID=69181 RepID=A0A8S9PRA2_BRACR|nr:hypothetical protein F2Q69_00049594 [Brassica cretica]
MAVFDYLWLRMIVVTSLTTSWRVVVLATSSGELSPFFSLSFSLSLSFLIFIEDGDGGKEGGDGGKEGENGGVGEKKVEMVGLGHYNSERVPSRLLSVRCVSVSSAYDMNSGTNSL